jgi:hypothetical protein
MRAIPPKIEDTIMNDRSTKRFVVSALHVAADSWDQLARDAGIPEFEQQATQARELAGTLQAELDKEGPTNERSSTG